MHEVGILRDAVRIAIAAAKENGAERITRITLEVGELAGVVPTALEFAYEAVTEDTIAAGSELAWREVPVECACASGCPNFKPVGVIYRCPICGVISNDIRTGRELKIVSIDVIP